MRADAATADGMAQSATSAPRPGDQTDSSLINDNEAGASANGAVHPAHSSTTVESKPDSSLLEPNERGDFPRLQRRTRVWWILALYLPLLVIPWALTCIMNYRPLTAFRYIEHTGWIRSVDFQSNERWQDAIDVMNAIAALLTIPVTSDPPAEHDWRDLWNNGG